MSGGTADEGRKAEGPQLDGSDADGAEAGPRPPAGSTRPKQSEWTVSDQRGPLRAPAEADQTTDEVERFVPGSEVDAEGLHDAPAVQPIEPVAPVAATERADAPIGDGLAGESMAATAEPHTARPTADAPPAVSVPAARPAGSGEATPARSSAWPIAVGVVVGSLIGGGSAALVYRTSEPSVPPVPPEVSTKLSELSSRLDAVERRPDPQAAIGDVRNEVHALSGRVAALEKMPKPAAAPAEAKPASPPAASASSAPAPAAGDLAAKVAALQSTLDGLGKQDAARQTAVKDLAGKLDALQASLAKVQDASRANADAVKGQGRDLDGKLAALQAAVGEAQRQAGAAQGSVASLQGNLTSVQSEQKTLAGKVGAPALAVAADSLVAQVQAGKPYQPQVEALASLGADPAKVAVLRENAATGVPSAQVLAASFAPLADPVIATGSKAPASAGFGEQVKHRLLGLIELHRTDKTTGDGLASRVALLQADLAHGDVVGAYDVWNALPADAKAKSSAWGMKAKSSAEAAGAARALQAQSIDTLAAKKS